MLGALQSANAAVLALPDQTPRRHALLTSVQCAAARPHLQALVPGARGLVEAGQR